MVSSLAKQLLMKQLNEINEGDMGFSVGLVDESDIYTWSIFFTGTEKTIYEGGFFKAIMKFPLDFPQNPPEMRFITKMWHPNSKFNLIVVFEDGKVCISILHKPGKDLYNEQEREDEKWRPVLGVEQILVSVISMLNDPNIDSPANVDAAKEFRDNRSAWENRVKKLVLQSMDEV